MGLVSRSVATGMAATMWWLAGSAAHATTPSPAALTAQFADMTGTGWTGGDASWSAQLADGRTVWLFGDTFLGGVDPATGRRDPGAPMVRNSVVIAARNGSMRTVVGGTPSEPGSLVPGRDADDWYWPGPPIAKRSSLDVPMAHIVRTGDGAWDFKAVGTSLARFALPGLRLERLIPVTTPPEVNMASAALTTQRFTYVYGTRDAWPGGKEAFVARVRGRDLTGRWTYWTGAGWSNDPAVASPIVRGVSDQFSVVRVRRRLVLITQVPLSNAIIAFSAKSPQGPWTPMGQIAATPRIPHAFTYNATVHPEYSLGSELVIGYNVNADTVSALWTDAALYRPRFMSVELPPSRERVAGDRWPGPAEHAPANVERSKSSQCHGSMHHVRPKRKAVGAALPDAAPR